MRSGTSQEKTTLEERVALLEEQFRELEARFKKIENEIAGKSPEFSESQIQNSTPKKAAWAFWQALKKNNVDVTKKYVITKNEAFAISPEFSRKMSAKIDKVLKRIEELAPLFPDTEWMSQEIVEKEIYSDSQFIGININLRLEGQIEPFPLMFVKIKEGYWKLTEAGG